MKYVLPYVSDKTAAEAMSLAAALARVPTKDDTLRDALDQCGDTLQRIGGARQGVGFRSEQGAVVALTGLEGMLATHGNLLRKHGLYDRFDAFVHSRELSDIIRNADAAGTRQEATAATPPHRK